MLVDHSCEPRLEPMTDTDGGKPASWERRETFNPRHSEALRAGLRDFCPDQGLATGGLTQKRPSRISGERGALMQPGSSVFMGLQCVWASECHPHALRWDIPFPSQREETFLRRAVVLPASSPASQLLLGVGWGVKSSRALPWVSPLATPWKISSIEPPPPPPAAGSRALRGSRTRPPSHSEPAVPLGIDWTLLGSDLSRLCPPNYISRPF